MIDVINGVSTALDTVKKLKEINDKVATAESSLLIVNLMEQLVEVKSLSLDLKGENLKLREEIQALKKIEKDELIFKGDAYYTASGDGPYCPACHDTRSLRVRMLLGDDGYSRFYYCSHSDCHVHVDR